jgi:hypothetical protein
MQQPVGSLPGARLATERRAPQLGIASTDDLSYLRLLYVYSQLNGEPEIDLPSRQKQLRSGVCFTPVRYAPTKAQRCEACGDG